MAKKQQTAAEEAIEQRRTFKLRDDQGNVLFEIEACRAARGIIPTNKLRRFRGPEMVEELKNLIDAASAWANSDG